MCNSIVELSSPLNLRYFCAGLGLFEVHRDNQRIRFADSVKFNQVLQ